MKKIWLAVLVVGIGLQACSMPGLAPAVPTSSPTSPATSTPTPPPTPTITPTLIPTPTPTPAPEVRVAEGDHALFNGDYEAAQAAYSTALDASSDPSIKAAAMLGLGRYHYLTGVYPNALNEFRAIVNDYPASSQAADAYYYLGETFFALDRYSEAADAYASYLTIHPGALDAFVNERRGDALSIAGDVAGALAAYTLAVQSPRLPTNFSLELKLAQTYVTLGDYPTAFVMYDDIYSRAAADDTKAQVDYYRGQMYATQGSPDQATTAYVDAVINFPRSYYSYLGLVELVNSGYPISELQRGLVDYYAGEYSVAMQAFDRYLYYNPDDSATALYYEGLIFREQDDPITAISLWDAVIASGQSAQNWDSAWEQKAYTQWAYQGDFVGGEQTLLDFVAAVPAHARAAEFLFDAGRIAERDERLPDAARDWQRIPVEYPASDYAYRAMFLAALCHYRLEDYSAAETAFQQAQEIATTPAERAGAIFWIAKSQAASGDNASAQTVWQQAASIDPTGYYSERARDILNNRTPFTPPKMVDLGIDRQSELRQAVLWMQTTFNYPSDFNFSVPGPLTTDQRFIRGQEFWRLGLSDQAEAEFNNLREEVASDPFSSYCLAVFLSDLGMYRQAILSARQVLDLAGLDDAGTLTAPVLFSHIRFGAFFPDLVVPIAQDSDFNPLFVWSILRQESLFDPTIQSNAGAIGLMQIMPVTGEEIVSRLSWPLDYTQADLLRPQVNLTLGLDYLATQRDALGGDLYAALAAYNGGPGNAASWQSLAKGDPDLFAEIVRFDETRQYLMGIYEVFTIYARLYARVP
ncbi:MAG: transglycosylase SLT domain-containing protein [Acidobacteriaceae bacterium]